MTADTAYFWEKGSEGVRILDYRSMDSLAAVPEEIDGQAVTELAPYLFSAHRPPEDAGRSGGAWQSGTGERITEEEALKLPEVKGSALKELRLPSALRRVGAYGLYNCEKLKKLELYSTTLDWGPGVFTGCLGVEEMVIHIDESQRSCFKEVLAELRQTVAVDYDGPERGRLIFPEFFEEAVENTPARILVTNTHGCGQKYRNAFVKTRFQFQEYDSLFPHVQVQEPEKLVISLAMGRLMYPCELTERYREQYLKYLTAHRIAAACQSAGQEDTEGLAWLMEHISYDPRDMKAVIETAGRSGSLAAVSSLMDKTGGQETAKRRRFAL